MEEPKKIVEQLFEKTEGYLKTTFEIYRLKLIQKSADVISLLMAKIAVGLLFSIFFVIFNIGCALWIGHFLNRDYAGYFIVSGIYLLGALIIFRFRKKWIIDPLKNSIIKQTM